MLDKRPQKLVIGISSRALFDLSASHSVYQEKGLDAYSKYQIEHEDDILEPGDAFAMVNKLLNINQLIGGDQRKLKLTVSMSYNIPTPMFGLPLALSMKRRIGAITKVKVIH